MPRRRGKENRPQIDRIIDGRVFQQNKVENGVIYFRCQKPHCFATAMIAPPESELKLNKPHSDGCYSDEDCEIIARFKNALKSALLRSFWRLKELYDTTASMYPEEIKVLVPFRSIESSMKNWRRNNYPPNPSHLEEMAEQLAKPENERLLHYDAGRLICRRITDSRGKVHVLLYDPQFVRKFFRTVQRLLMDCTFQTTPKVRGVYQLMTILGVTYGHAIPFMHILMASKTEAAYTAVLKEVASLLSAGEVVTVMTDFEQALRNACKKVFPNAHVTGCNFHYDRALLKKINKLKLNELISENQEAKMFVKKIMALAFLPESMILDEYKSLQSALSRDLRTAFGGFLKYYEAQWLKIVKPEGFSVHGLSRRTNNVTESYNSALAHYLGKHPSAWTFLDKLLKLISNASADVQRLIRSKRITRHPRYSTVYKQKELVKAWQQLYAGDITREEFMNKAAMLKGNVRQRLQEIARNPAPEVRMEQTPENMPTELNLRALKAIFLEKSLSGYMLTSPLVNDLENVQCSFLPSIKAEDPEYEHEIFADLRFDTPGNDARTPATSANRESNSQDLEPLPRQPRPDGSGLESNPSQERAVNRGSNSRNPATSPRRSDAYESDLDSDLSQESAVTHVSNSQQASPASSDTDGSDLERDHSEEKAVSPELNSRDTRSPSSGRTETDESAVESDNSPERAIAYGSKPGIPFRNTLIPGELKNAAKFNKKQKIFTFGGIFSETESENDDPPKHRSATYGLDQQLIIIDDSSDESDEDRENGPASTGTASVKLSVHYDYQSHYYMDDYIPSWGGDSEEEAPEAPLITNPQVNARQLVADYESAQDFSLGTDDEEAPAAPEITNPRANAQSLVADYESEVDSSLNDTEAPKVPEMTNPEAIARSLVADYESEVESTLDIDDEGSRAVPELMNPPANAQRLVADYESEVDLTVDSDDEDTPGTPGIMILQMNTRSLIADYESDVDLTLDTDDDEVEVIDRRVIISNDPVATRAGNNDAASTTLVGSTSTGGSVGAIPSTSNLTNDSQTRPSRSRKKNLRKKRSRKRKAENGAVPPRPCGRKRRRKKASSVAARTPQVPSQRSTCAICLIEEANHVFLPCGHCVCCGPCTAELMARNEKKCPNCRQRIAGYIQAYFN